MDNLNNDKKKANHFFYTPRCKLGLKKLFPPYINNLYLKGFPQNLTPSMSAFSFFRLNA